MRADRVVTVTVLHGLEREDPRVQRARLQRSEAWRQRELAIESFLGLAIYTAAGD